MAREAACSCGNLRLTVEGEPARVSICHCLACQRRTGSAFGVQARFDESQVRIAGAPSEYVRISDDGDERIFSFCSECGGTVAIRYPGTPGIVAVPVGAFAHPSFPAPIRSFYESRRHSWVSLPDELERETE